MQSLSGIVTITDPQGPVLPVLVDSPHSGRRYPDEFRFACPRSALERYEDRDVDQLVRPLAACGATVITAEVTRTFIDLNRAHDDIAPRLVDGGWDGPFPLKPSAYSDRGVGLIWESSDDTLIYARHPTTAEIMARIEQYYHPYYAALNDRAQLLRARFGRFVHLNVHSMPPHINNGKTDIVLGDLGGISCTRAFRDLAASVFTDAGFRVAINTPYRGARLTELFGHPHKRSESIQIEISKALYLQRDLQTRDMQKSARLEETLAALVAACGAYANTSANDSLSAASRSSIDTVLPSAASDVTP